MNPISTFQGEIDIKNFKKGKRLNKGGFGVVYQVEEKTTGELFAAKVIDCGDDEEQCSKMIEREVKIMICAKHPTIIKFIGYSKLDFLEENNVTIIMELAKNGSLSDVIKKNQNGEGPHDYTNTSRQIILAGVSRGMKYLHDRNIIHRDLKAGNILLDSDFHPYITDFGMSKFFEVDHSYSQSQFGGTISYQAPEILKCNQYDRKVDVYAFGILMFEIITDKFAYPELLSGKMSDFDFRNKVVNENYRPKFDLTINDHFKELIAQCWSDDPNNRPTFEEIFKKLANFDSENDYILDDVDIDEFNIYVENITEVTDRTEQLLDKISKIEKENQQLKQENCLYLKKIQELKNENEKNIKKISLIEQENEKIKSENEKVKSDTELYLKKISELEKKLAQNVFNDEQETKEASSEKDDINTTITFSEFNNLSIKSKQDSLQKIPKGENDAFLTKINDFICYFLQFNQLIEEPCFNVKLNDETMTLSQNIDNDYRILIRSKAVEILFTTENLNLINLLEIARKFTEVTFEIEYPSEQFQDIYDKVLKIIKSQNDELCTLTISVFITKGDLHFSGNKDISYVELGSCFDGFVRNVSKGSFDNFSSLKQVIIPSSVISVENISFFNCSSLKQITIPPKIKVINSYAFRKCSSLKRFNIPSSVKRIEEAAFADCTSLSQIEIPSSVEYINIYAFQSCTSLTEITIPSSVKYFKSSVFVDCSSLKQVNILSNLKEIPKTTFKNCSSLTNFTIPSTVTIIDWGAFCGCSSLTQITIPSSVTLLSNAVFDRCSSLTQITIPASVTKIYDELFFKCSSLKDVTILAPLTKMGDKTFLDCISLEEIKLPPSLTEIGKSFFYGCKSLKNVVIPSSVTTINKTAFYDCCSLTEIEIPSSVTKIDGYAFRGCSSLKKITLPPFITSIKEFTFCLCTSLKEISIPPSVTSIGEGAFAITSLIQVSIPSLVTSIGPKAFYNCSNLAKISIPFSVTEIGDKCFDGCTSLTNIAIPSSLNSEKLGLGSNVKIVEE